MHLLLPPHSAGMGHSLPRKDSPVQHPAPTSLILVPMSLGLQLASPQSLCLQWDHTLPIPPPSPFSPVQPTVH